MKPALWGRPFRFTGYRVGWSQYQLTNLFMRYEVECKDIAGISDCSFVAGGESLDQLAAELREHGLTHHPEIMKALTDQERAAMGQKIEQRVAEQEQQRS